MTAGSVWRWQVGPRQAACVLALGALAGAFSAVACPTDLPVGLRGESVGDETVVNGLPMTIRQVTGREPAVDILSRVARVWADQGYDVRHERAGEWDVVSARSAKCNATLQLVDRNGAFGYLAVSTPSRAVNWLPRRLGFALPGGVSLNTTVSSKDDGRTGHTIAFSTRRTVADINDYFMSELTRTGWQAVATHELRIGRDATAQIVTAQKGREQISVVLRDDGITRAVLNLSESL